MIRPSLHILCCCEGISIDLSYFCRSFTYVAEMGNNFEDSFAPFVQKAYDFSIAPRGISFPECWLIILF